MMSTRRIFILSRNCISHPSSLATAFCMSYSPSQFLYPLSNKACIALTYSRVGSIFVNTLFLILNFLFYKLAKLKSKKESKVSGKTITSTNRESSPSLEASSCMHFLNVPNSNLSFLFCYSCMHESFFFFLFGCFPSDRRFIF